MIDLRQFDSTDPRYYTSKLKKMLAETVEQARDDVSRISDPKGQALFETTAEVLKGLLKAFSDFEEKNEKAWRAAGS